MLERERDRGREGGSSLGQNLEQLKGISFLQTGMERDMGEVGFVFGFLCLLY